MYFTDREEAFADLLIRLGTKRNVALVLTYLAHIPEATSRQIERGTDLRQPEVSIAVRYLNDRDWIEKREYNSPSKGRPIRIYNLSRPLPDILKAIEDEKKGEADLKIQLARKLRDYIR
jgi:predicted transcriptional regulator